MREIFNDMYDHAASGGGVTFQFTGNHTDNSGTNPMGTASFAAGNLYAPQQSTMDTASIPSLVSDPVRWHFLRSNRNGRLEDYGSDQDKMILSIFMDRGQEVLAGTLRNSNWPGLIAIPRLDVLKHRDNAYLLYGIDANAAAVAIAVLNVPKSK